MFKFLSISMLAMAGLFVLAGSADAAWWPRARCYYYVAPAAAAPVASAPAPATAEAPRVYRSYSYEPAAPATRYYTAPSRGYRADPGGNFDAGRKIRGL